MRWWQVACVGASWVWVWRPRYRFHSWSGHNARGQATWNFTWHKSYDRCERCKERR